MKAMFGQYGKVAVLVLAVMSLLIFLFSTGENSFTGKMQATKPEADYGKEDNGDLMDQIAARKPPIITVTQKKLESGQTYQFAELASAEFADEHASNQNLFVKKMVLPNGDIITDKTELASPIKVSSGQYSVTYRAEETFKGALKHSEKTVVFLVD